MAMAFNITLPIPISMSGTDRTKQAVLFALILLLGGYAHSQTPKFSFGPLIGTYVPNVAGESLVGDVVVFTQPDAGDGERFIGLFANYKLRKRLEFQSDFFFTRQFVSFTVFNRAEQCAFCPVRKGSSMGMNIFELAAAVKFNFLSIGELHFAFKGGPSVQSRSRAYEDTHSVASFGTWAATGLPRHPGVAEVVNQIEDAFKPFIGYWNYGLQLQYRRVFFVVFFQDMMGSTFAEPLSLNGESYPFFVNSRNLSFSAGYHFYRFGKRKNV
jgi:hypothetical protein